LERSEIRLPAFQKLINDMIETMHEYHGVGLAAPQVHEGLRVFVAAISPDDEEPLPAGRDPLVVINPVVTPVGTDTLEDWEGCLSVPDIRGRVPRPRAITVSALDRSGARLEMSTHDFPARVIQHETDHLDGVLFLDRVKRFDTLTFLDEYARYWVKD
jgi:peptide deformylase